ncbi:MAG: hypothetical protein M3P24_08155, partial [Gemmatimonadota bacterium]|nr:hypothetical protein [Gemmatimonadota bacterium]
VRYGWVVGDSTPTAFQVGFYVPALVLFPFAELDLYAQAPAAPGAPVYGAGMLLAADHFMPYAQLGRVPPGRPGWYTTQGVAFVFHGHEAGPARYWSPALAYRFIAWERTAHLFLTGGIGRRTVFVYQPQSPPLERSEPLRFLMVGVVLHIDLDLSSPLRPFPPF